MHNCITDVFHLFSFPNEDANRERSEITMYS